MITESMSLFKYIEDLGIKGVQIFEPRIFDDHRGSVTKVFNYSAYSEKGLENEWKEMLVTDNRIMGTIRGFHFQKPPYEQAKIMIVSRGEIYIWLVDIRKGSDTYGKVAGTKIDSVRKRFIYIPVGVANAYQVIMNDTQVIYLLSNEYNEDAATGILWSSLGLDPIIDNTVVSEKDLMLPQWSSFSSPF